MFKMKYKLLAYARAMILELAVSYVDCLFELGCLFLINFWHVSGFGWANEKEHEYVIGKFGL
jgi:hypothetical protein